MDPTIPVAPTKDQTGAFWVEILSHDHASGHPAEARADKDQELLDLCRQFGDVGI
ncbi:hypothetical protein DXG01_007445 [Tephrocybe rancida]|nr:hypothetical protein DXG01_007445 [Tephrocybe rancida]